MPGSFSKEFPPWIFLPSATNCHDPGQTVLPSCPCGPEGLATSSPSQDAVSGQEFLISHLLQYRPGLQKDFFRSLVLFILFLVMLGPNPCSGGEFCAHCLDGEAETSGKAKDWLGSPQCFPSCFHTYSLPTSPQLLTFSLIHYIYPPPQHPGSSSFTLLEGGVRRGSAVASGKRQLGVCPSDVLVGL